MGRAYIGIYKSVAFARKFDLNHMQIMNLQLKDVMSYTLSDVAG